MELFLTPIHQKILNVINQSGVVVIVNEHPVCYNDKYDGYFITTKDPLNKSNSDELVICFDTIKKNYYGWIDELNRTIAHEAIHVAQECKYDDGYIRPLGFRKDKESEAFAVQDNPKEVLRIVEKYCL